jgi:hypothetical protein
VNVAASNANPVDPAIVLARRQSIAALLFWLRHKTLSYLSGPLGLASNRRMTRVQ